MSSFWAFCLAVRLDGGYTIKNFDGTVTVLKTNQVSNTAFRGFGGPEGAYPMEIVLGK